MHSRDATKRLIYDIMFIEAQQILRHAAANVVKQSK